MYPLSRWITPEHEKYRYDTRFYVVPLRVAPQIAIEGAVHERGGADADVGLRARGHEIGLVYAV
jgi:hypothetical protein